MSTKIITLTCEHCNKEFDRRLAEYNYQMKKNPNRKIFCSINCTTSYYNKMSETGSKNIHPKLMPMYNNKFGLRYPEGMGYYVNRCAKDKRFSSFTNQHERNEFGKHIKELWDNQNGKCAITSVALYLRSSTGRCASTNPFKIASLDRIDCSKPYKIGNVQWVSYAINLARNNMESNAFESHLKEFLKEVKDN